MSARRVGIALRQSSERVSKPALVRNGCYFHARQMQRARRKQRREFACLGRVIRDIERKLPEEHAKMNWLPIHHI